MRCGGEGVAVWLEPGIREENEQTCGLGAGNSWDLLWPWFSLCSQGRSGDGDREGERWGVRARKWLG